MADRLQAIDDARTRVRGDAFSLVGRTSPSPRHCRKYPPVGLAGPLGHCLAPPSGPVTPTEAGIYSPGGSVQLDELGATRGLDTVADGPADGARFFRVTQVTHHPD